VEKLAVPDEREPVPSEVVPSKMVTIPVGIPDPDVSATFAVKVTVVPDVALAAEAVRVVEVAAGGGAELTTIVIAADVLALKVESPE
jgi:hypothetical protein